jgi:hypothetical protein
MYDAIYTKFVLKNMKSRVFTLCPVVLKPLAQENQ